VHDDRAGPSAFARALAALTALGLGVVAAALAVAGHPPWEGPVVMGLTDTHGIHQGDVVALAPLAAGTWLAWWCWTRRPR